MLAQKLNLMSQITMRQASETTILTSVLKLLDELNHRLLNEFEKTEKLEDDHQKKNRQYCEHLIEQLKASHPNTPFDKYTIMVRTCATCCCGTPCLMIECFLGM